MAFTDNTDTHNVVLLQPLQEPPKAEEFRLGNRMPLDCARDQIYAAAREIQHILNKMEASETFDLTNGAPGIHNHLLSLCLEEVCVYHTDKAGVTEFYLEELHTFESLFYITIIHIHYFYTMLSNSVRVFIGLAYQQCTDDLTYLQLLENFFYHWEVLMNPQLLATLDFVVRKERLFKLKMDHNKSIFMKSRKFAGGQTEATMTNSIRNALDAIAFNESQLTSDVLGLNEHFSKEFNPSDLLMSVGKKHAVALAGWLEMNEVYPMYEIRCDGFHPTSAPVEACTINPSFDKEDTCSVAAAKIMAAEENLPKPPPISPLTFEFDTPAAAVIRDWLNRTEAIQNIGPEPIKFPKKNVSGSSDSGYIDGSESDELTYYTEYESTEQSHQDQDQDQDQGQDHNQNQFHYYPAKGYIDLTSSINENVHEQRRHTDPFLEHDGYPAAQNAKTNSSGSKKRPAPIDVELANKRARMSPETPIYISSSPTVDSPGTGLFVSLGDQVSEQILAFIQDSGAPAENQAAEDTDDFFPMSSPPAKPVAPVKVPAEQEKPRLRCGFVVSPISTVPPVAGDATITHCSETASQHHFDMVMNGELVARERQRAMRALLGEENSSDEAKKDASVPSDSSTFLTWRKFTHDYREKDW